LVYLLGALSVILRVATLGVGPGVGVMGFAIAPDAGMRAPAARSD
jgi:hypothetical protein